MPTQIMIRKSEYRWTRWLGIALRSLHLAGVVLAGVAILGNGTLPVAGVVLMLLTGFALYGIELWHHPDLWREVAGVFIAAKLIVLLAMLLVPDLAGPLFWLLLISSSVVSHAPRVFRHRRILG
jgi:hypothetical protein